MTRAALAVVLGAVLLAACTERPDPYVIPGPTAPTRTTTEQPLMWDSRAELADWLDNGVTRGPVTLEGEGRDAFLRVRRGSTTAVLRGPDLPSPAEGVHSARIRVRLRFDSPPTGSFPRTDRFTLTFEVANPPTPGAQPYLFATVQPGDDWQELTLQRDAFCCAAPFTVRYAYVQLQYNLPATLDIDWMAFVR